MNRQFFYGGVILLVLSAAGCSNNVRVSGKVTFPDEKPLTVGKVIFETDSFVASGDLQPDGTYTLGSIKKNDGIPPGTYRVSVAGAMQPGKNITTSTSIMGADGSKNAAAVPMTLYSSAIATKYCRGETSGLTCEVKKSMTFDFKVEPPK